MTTTLDLQAYELDMLHMLVGNRLAEVDANLLDNARYQTSEYLRRADLNYRNDLSALLDKLEGALLADARWEG
jgi:hypothetical protein